MRRTFKNSIAITCSICLLAASVFALPQEPKPKPQADENRKQVLVDGTFKLLSMRMIESSVQVVTGAPYSAKGINETVQTLADGNQIIQRHEATFYRDNEGRTRIEEQLGSLGKWTAAESPQPMVMISDPVAGMFYNLDPQNHRASKYPRKQSVNVPELVKNKRAIEDEQKKLITKEKEKADTKPEPRQARPFTKDEMDEVALKKVALAKRADARTESLGRQVIEGVEAEGTRKTATIPAGEIGNIQPIEIVDEQWYSSELHLPIMTKHRDPRSGETTFRLTNINRSEPDRSLFEVPADYTVVEGPFLKPMPKSVAKPENF